VYRESGGNEAAQPVAGVAVNTGDTTGPNVDATEPNVPTHPKRSYRYTTFVLLLAISVPAFQFYLLSLLLIRVKDISTETDASKDPMNLAFAIIFLALKVIAHIFKAWSSWQCHSIMIQRKKLFIFGGSCFLSLD
jgi:hypothetical protein